MKALQILALSTLLASSACELNPPKAQNDPDRERAIRDKVCGVYKKSIETDLAPAADGEPAKHIHMDVLTNRRRMAMAIMNNKGTKNEWTVIEPCSYDCYANEMRIGRIRSDVAGLRSNQCPIADAAADSLKTEEKQYANHCTITPDMVEK